MRIVTQTLSGTKVVAKANGKQRTVTFNDGNVSKAHAAAAVEIIKVIGAENVGAEENWTAVNAENNRLIWNV